MDKALQDKIGYELNLRFSGQYFDKETGLYYNHHRYYDPSTGRYLTPDPLGLAGGDNLYTYVNNSPVHYNDPVGLLLFAFDGMGNQDYGIPPNQHSHVVKFRTAYRKDPNEPSFPSNTKWKYATVNSKWFGLGKSSIEQKEQKVNFANGLNANGQKNGSYFAENNIFYISGAGTTDQYTDISNGTADSVSV